MMSRFANAFLGGASEELIDGIRVLREGGKFTAWPRLANGIQSRIHLTL